MKKVLVIVAVLFSSFFLTGCTEEIDKEIDNITYVYPDSKDTIVSLSEYNQIKSGITEQEVWNIIGGVCTNTGTTDIGMGDQYVTVSYGCNGEGKTGANVILMFQGGKLTTFSQFGLN